MIKYICFIIIGLSQISMYAENLTTDKLLLQANESPPFWSKELPFYGMAGEILHHLSKETGIKTSIEFKPLTRLIEDDENNDLGNPVFFLPKQDFAQIIPLITYESAFYFYQPNTNFVFNSLDDLAGKTIGILKGALIDKAYFEAKGVRFEESYSHGSLFKKLKLGRVDLVLEIELVSQYHIMKMFPKEFHKFVAVKIKNSSSPIAIMISQEQVDANRIGQRYQKALNKIIKNGTYKKIVEKYYHHHALPVGWIKSLQRFTQLYMIQEEQ